MHQDTCPINHRHVQRTPVQVKREIKQVVIEGEIVIQSLGIGLGNGFGPGTASTVTGASDGG